jgi:hypothetical protein
MFCILDHAFSNYDERKTYEMHFQINHIFRIRRLSSGSFGLSEDGAPAAPKHVGAGLIF